jgi:hypothetical protein
VPESESMHTTTLPWVRPLSASPPELAKWFGWFAIQLDVLFSTAIAAAELVVLVLHIPRRMIADHPNLPTSMGHQDCR